MPSVDFYVLPDNTVKSYLDFTCRLVEKARKQKHRVYIHTDHQQQASEVDAWLWTFDEASFLPHQLVTEKLALPAPIQIGYDVPPDDQCDVLINLSTRVPAFYAQFNRILEIVILDPDAQALGRERYRFYRTQDLEINTHKL